MNQQPTQFNRFRVMSALALAVLGVYLVVLFNIQVVHHDDYLAQSTQAIARVEDVKASRGHHHRPFRPDAGLQPVYLQSNL